jgi:hypothetical protein
LGQLTKHRDPAAGYSEWLAERMEAVLVPCRASGTRIVSNMGAANPVGAAERIVDLARSMGLSGLRVAAVTGDDVLDQVKGIDLEFLDRTGTVASVGDDVVAANAYLGCGPIVDALRQGADVVITGRVADPSLFLAPLVHEFGWPRDNWDLMGKGTCVGHMLECASQVTGGYFADPGYKEVPNLAWVGFPIAEVAEDGCFTVSMVEGAGGRVDVQTCTEQLLYEVHDPSAYISPDAVADFSQVHFEEVGENRVAVSGATGRQAPSMIKVSVGYLDGHIGEGEISYAGPNAEARGRLALEIVRQRLAAIEPDIRELRFDLIGVDAVHLCNGSVSNPDPPEVRIRIAGRTDDPLQAQRIGREVVALWLNGPAGGGGATRRAREVVAVASVLIPTNHVRPEVTLWET